MISDSSCIFCKIVGGEAVSSVVYEDDLVMAFMNIRPVNRGEFLIIPKEHIDHFCDVPDEVACHIMIHAQRLSRNLRARLNPQRVGLVVHGWGVPHAHLVVVPLHESSDIVSAKLASIEDDQVKFNFELLPEPSRIELDELAKLLA
jgi:histidine triad (HIT) family protein